MQPLGSMLSERERGHSLTHIRGAIPVHTQRRTQGTNTSALTGSQANDLDWSAPSCVAAPRRVSMQPRSDQRATLAGQYRHKHNTEAEHDKQNKNKKRRARAQQATSESKAQQATTKKQRTQRAHNHKQQRRKHRQEHNNHKQQRRKHKRAHNNLLKFMVLPARRRYRLTSVRGDSWEGAGQAMFPNAKWNKTARGNLLV